MYDVLDTLCLILGFVKSGVVCGELATRAFRRQLACVVWRVSRWVGLVLRSWFVRFMCKQASLFMCLSRVCVQTYKTMHTHVHTRTAACAVSRLSPCR